VTDQLTIATTDDGRTVVRPDEPRQMDERDRQTFTQDRLFNAPATMAGQITLGGIE
jgi:hypothetical protein